MITDKKNLTNLIDKLGVQPKEVTLDDGRLIKLDLKEIQATIPTICIIGPRSMGIWLVWKPGGSDGIKDGWPPPPRRRSGYGPRNMKQ